jgi:hypothetical protein
MSRFSKELLAEAEKLSRHYKHEGRQGLYREAGYSDWVWSVEKMFQENPSALITRKHLNKTGSDLSFIISEETSVHGVVINKLPSVSAQIWKELHLGLGKRKFPDNEVFADWGGFIPVAPILQRKKGKLRMSERAGQAIVCSRFCGFTFDYYKNHYRYPPQDRDLKTQEIIVKLHKKLESIYDVLYHGLRLDARVHHGHLNDDNLFVEFIDLDFYQSMVKQGYTVNSIPYSREHFEYGLSEKYLSNPDRFIEVMRIGDFDKARDYDEWKFEQNSD